MKVSVVGGPPIKSCGRFRGADSHPPLTRKPRHVVKGKRDGTEPALIRKPAAASTVRGTPSTSNFPGVNPSRCPPHGQATTPAFRGADRLPSAHAASGCRKVPRRGHSGKPRFPSRTVRGADSGIGIRVSAGRTVGSSEHDVDDGKVSAVEGASIRKLQQIPPRGQWSRYSGVRGADR